MATDLATSPTLDAPVRVAIDRDPPGGIPGVRFILPNGSVAEFTYELLERECRRQEISLGFIGAIVRRVGPMWGFAVGRELLDELLRMRKQVRVFTSSPGLLS